MGRGSNSYQITLNPELYNEMLVPQVLVQPISTEQTRVLELRQPGGWLHGGPHALLSTIVFSAPLLPTESYNIQLLNLIMCKTCRALMAALLHHVSVHPHAVVVKTLGIISSKALQPAQGLPPHVQAEAFSDAALLQASPFLLMLLIVLALCLSVYVHPSVVPFFTASILTFFSLALAWDRADLTMQNPCAAFELLLSVSFETMTRMQSHNAKAITMQHDRLSLLWEPSGPSSC